MTEGEAVRAPAPWCPSKVVGPGGLLNDRPSYSALRTRTGNPLRAAPHRPRPRGTGQDARAGRLRLAGRADGRRGAGCDQERRRAGPAGCPERGRGAGRAAVAGRPQRGAGLHDRARLLRHLHPAGHPAQRDGEPRLVHGLHAVPAGDLAGPARGAAELPDRGRRAHRTAHVRRLPARRGHRRRRGDGPVAAHGQEQEGPLPGRRGRPSADDRRDRDPRRADRRRGRRRRPERRHPRRARRARDQRRTHPVPGCLRRRTRHQAGHRPGARARRPRHRRRRPARPHPAEVAR
ncbi:glycine dehydrogenase [Streptomyces griseoflavus Tu4000]|uniref:Glycine dehydrogenase n=1 Tax=Streptomyces griseoflavus Tu4000 TaxID=467200 RepID=D9XVY3_9ACTN|nr:glycine dehydrogenase [Streptomyces griseoflavus Tu4000]